MRNPPCPGRGDNHTEQQDPGFVHRALKRHCFAGNGDSTLERFFVQSGIGSFEKARHRRTPLKTEHSADIEIELAISNSRSSHRTALVSSAQRTRYLAEYTESRVPRSHHARTELSKCANPFSENGTSQDISDLRCGGPLLRVADDSPRMCRRARHFYWLRFSGPI